VQSAAAALVAVDAATAHALQTTRWSVRMPAG
jgi:hypothetical protein